MKLLISSIVDIDRPRKLERWFRSLRVYVAAGVLMAACTLGAAAATIEKASTSLYEDAVANYENGEYKTAVIHLKNLLRKNPFDLPARVLIGRTYLKLGDPISAEKELRRARAGGGDEELIIVPLASAISMQRRYDEVIDDIPVAGRSAEVEASLQVVRGLAFLALRRLSSAVRAFERAEELHPNAAVTRIGLAQYNMALNDFDEAAHLIEEAISLSPKNFLAWSTKGQLLRRLRQFTKAMSAYDKALALEPDDIASRIARANLLVGFGRWPEAEQDIAFVLEARPRNPQAIYLKAVKHGRDGDETGYSRYLHDVDSILRSLTPKELRADPKLLLLSGLVNNGIKNYPDAYNALDEFIKFAPYHVGARKILGSLLLRRGNNRAALTMLQLAETSSPNDPALLRLLGIALMKNDRFLEAGRVFQKTLLKSPKDASLQTFLATSRLRTGHRYDAIAGLEIALASDPAAIRPGLMLALILLQERKFQDAANVAAKIATRRPKDPTPLNILGAAKWGLGDAAGAREDLEQALAHDPSYIDAHKNLALIDFGEGKVEAAKDRYKFLSSQDDAGTGPLIALASIAKREKNFEEAISYLSKAREKDRENRVVQLDLIRTFQQVGDIDSAKRNARKLRDKFPDDLNVLERLGLVELADGNLKGAAATFNRMRDLTRGADPRLLRIARYLTRAKDRVGAHKVLLKAVTSNPKNLSAQAAIVALETRMGRHERALLRTDTLRENYPRLSLGHALRGDVMMRMKRYGEAVEAYAAALRLKETGDLLTRLMLARQKANVGKLPVARLEKWIKSNPKDARSRHALGGAYIYKKQYNNAIRHYSILYKNRPRDIAALNNLAWLFQETKDDRALEYAKKAFETAPRQPQTLDTYGWILVASGEVERGLGLLRDAYTRSSRNFMIRYHLAYALNLRGRTKEARRQLKDIVKFGKNDEYVAKAQRLLDKIGD